MDEQSQRNVIYKEGQKVSYRVLSVCVCVCEWVCVCAGIELRVCVLDCNGDSVLRVVDVFEIVGHHVGDMQIDDPVHQIEADETNGEHDS